jgi:hypothetical protein
MFNTIFGAEAVRAGAASRYGSGSDQKMRLRFHNTAENVVIVGEETTGSRKPNLKLFMGKNARNFCYRSWLSQKYPRENFVN